MSFFRPGSQISLWCVGTTRVSNPFFISGTTSDFGGLKFHCGIRGRPRVSTQISYFGLDEFIFVFECLNIPGSEISYVVNCPLFCIWFWSAICFPIRSLRFHPSGFHFLIFEMKIEISRVQGWGSRKLIWNFGAWDPRFLNCIFLKMKNRCKAAWRHTAPTMN